jgi:hypothetical protein
MCVLPEAELEVLRQDAALRSVLSARTGGYCALRLPPWLPSETLDSRSVSGIVKGHKGVFIQ